MVNVIGPLAFIVSVYRTFYDKSVGACGAACTTNSSNRRQVFRRVETRREWPRSMLIAVVDYAFDLGDFLGVQIGTEGKAATSFRDRYAAALRKQPRQCPAEQQARGARAVLIEESYREDFSVDAAKHARAGLVPGMAREVGHCQGFPVEPLLFPMGLDGLVEVAQASAGDTSMPSAISRSWVWMS